MSYWADASLTKEKEMSYVRQHYKLATTGKLGQNATGKSPSKSGSKASDSQSTMKSGSHRSGSTKKGGY